MNAEIDSAIRNSLLAFAMKAYAQLHPGRQLIAHPYLRLIALNLEKVAQGETKRLCVSLPPRHGKSFMASISFAAWLLAQNPSTKILLVSYGQELAERIAYDIRRILQSEWFGRLFKAKIAKKRSKLTDFVTTAGGGLRSVSVEGGITGLGGDVIIIDDPVQIKDCENLKQLERINDLFDSEILTRLNDSKKGTIVLVAHRVAENDLTGHVLGQGDWEAVRLPMVATRARTYVADGFLWQRKRGELLRPDAFTPRDIARLRLMKRPGFETLQQQNPGRRDRLRIKAEFFGWFDSGALPSDSPVALSIDPGQKGGPNNSFSVVQAWTVSDGRYLLLNQWRAQARYDELRYAVRGVIRKFRPSVVLVEATGQGPALISDIRPQQGMTIHSITPSEAKVKRLRKHQKILRAGLVSLPAGNPWVTEFINEITLFPYAESDNQVDAVSMFLDFIIAHPVLEARPARAIAVGRDSHGPIPLRGVPTRQEPGIVIASRFRRWWP